MFASAKQSNCQPYECAVLFSMCLLTRVCCFSFTGRRDVCTSSVPIQLSAYNVVKQSVKYQHSSNGSVVFVLNMDYATENHHDWVDVGMVRLCDPQCRVLSVMCLYHVPVWILTILSVRYREQSCTRTDIAESES